MHERTNTHTRMHGAFNAHEHKDMHTFSETNMHARTHTYTHTHTHTHTLTDKYPLVKFETAGFRQRYK